MSLLDWINTHDCGVSPTGVANPDGSITIRVTWVNTNTDERGTDETTVRTYQEARDALGY